MAWISKVSVPSFHRLGESVDKVAFAVYVALSREYEKQYDQEYAKFLAVAVSNELFSRQAGNTKGQDFLRRNNDVVIKETHSVKDYKDICEIVTMAVAVQTILDCEPVESEDPSEILKSYSVLGESIEKIKKIGVFMQREWSYEDLISSTVFCDKADSFCKAVLGQQSK